MNIDDLCKLASILESSSSSTSVGNDKKPIEPTGSCIKIAILQRGWVMVGYYSRNGENCALSKASVIRTWGSVRGLGEIATNGPTNKTVLDPCPTVRFHLLTLVALMDCKDSKWESSLV